MNESNEEKSSETIQNIYETKQNKKGNFLKNFTKKKKFNGSTKKLKKITQSNGHSNFSLNRFKSHNIKDTNIPHIIKTNENISNGETNEKGEKTLKENNYNLISKKLLLISKKEKKNINKDKDKNNNINDDIVRSQTSKNLLKLDGNRDEEEKIKDKRNKLFERKKKNKSKTVLFEPKLAKAVKYNIHNHIKFNNKFLPSQNAKSRNIDKSLFFIKTEKNFNNIGVTQDKTEDNYTLPFLTMHKPPSYDNNNNNNNYKDNTHKHKILYKSFNRLKEPHNSRKEKKFSFPKNALNIMDNFKIKENQNTKSVINNRVFSKFQRKQTQNDIILKTDLISHKLISINKLNNKKNKFLKKLEQNLKSEHPNYFLDNWKDFKRTEVSSSLIFIEKKINNWVSDLPSNNINNEHKIIFDMKEYQKNKKEKKYFKRIIKDFIPNIFSIQYISNSYFLYHKGIIEQNILLYLQKKFFDIHLPSYIFEYKYNKLYLSKVTSLNQKKLLKKRTETKLQFNSKGNNFSKKGRRLSSLQNFRKRSTIQNVILPLSENEKKSILYLYYLDLDIDLDPNYQENINIENEDKDGFLELLRGNYNKTETKDLIINKFISNYIKKNGKRNKTLPYNKKNSIINNNVINKGLNLKDSKKNKSPLFKNKFFFRNEIKRSTNKLDKKKKKKSVLEYNLLFDPSLTGYNNLITDADADVAFESNTQKTIINKRKIKEIQKIRNKQLTSLLISSGGMKTDKNIIVMKTLDIKNQYNHKNKGNIKSLTSSIKDCNYDSFVKFYRNCKCGPNAKDKDGNSLLSLAVKSSCLEIVNFLLEEKANPNLQNVSKYIFIFIFFQY